MDIPLLSANSVLYQIDISNLRMKLQRADADEMFMTRTAISSVADPSKPEDRQQELSVQLL
jgi:hypothetical protein